MNQIKIFVLILMLGSTQVYASPTAGETMVFVKKIIKSKEYSSRSSSSNSDYSDKYRKPNITKLSECKYSFKQRYWWRRGNRKGANEYWITIDFTKQNTSYDSGVMAILIKDRQGINSIDFEDYSYQTEKYSKDKLSTASIEIDINGIYIEKMDKALKHMSKICYKKYGVKNDDPF